MPVAVSYPGVYVQEQGSGARAVAAVPTAHTLFIGMAEQGRMDTPVKVQTIAQFDREFGTRTSGELRDQVVQFFLNGGATAYVCRIADGEESAAVTLRSESGTDRLRVVARDAGDLGNMIRLEVDYATGDPERTFNLTVYRRAFKPDSTPERRDAESYTGLSMNPASVDFVESRINGISGLITVTALVAGVAGRGVSIAGRIFPDGAAAAVADLQARVIAGRNALRIAVGDSRPIAVALPLPPGGNPTLATITDAWEDHINLLLAGESIPHQVVVAMSGPGQGNGGIGSNAATNGRLLSITCATAPVRIAAATGSDVTAELLLGTAGGIEGDDYGDARPAPTGLVARNGNSGAANGFAAFRRFLAALRAEITGFTLADDSGGADLGAGAVIGLGAAGRTVDLDGQATIGNALAALDQIAEVIDANAEIPGDGFGRRWTARRHGTRLALTPRYGGDNSGVGGRLTTQGGANIGAANFPFATAANPENVAAYTVGLPNGVAGAGDYVNPALTVQGDNGGLPTAPDYAAMFAIVDRDVDIFNLLVLPRADGQDDAARKPLFAAASAFCERKRAFLIVDPPGSWKTIEAAEANVDTLRIGLETRNSAAYWPRLKIDDGTRQGKFIDPAGSIAGLIARTDANRGVWKAPAGLEATIRGVTGVERRMTDPDNGSINPKALNAVRVFPAGVVAWGARTLVGFDGSGNIDDKYVPVRRTMLFIEESLYRGLHFAVFEPNDEPLWAQIRLAAGSFMAGLFRQRAFAGRTARDAYFVACDATTTTPDDINLGIVNVIVGFAPLKPAEFVVLTVKQIAGQVQI